MKTRRCDHKWFEELYNPDDGFFCTANDYEPPMYRCTKCGKTKEIHIRQKREWQEYVLMILSFPVILVYFLILPIIFVIALIGNMFYSE
jgi:hypothetical protein